MDIFIMRHGEAEAYREPDATRSLTAVGEQQADCSARWLQRQVGQQDNGGHIDLVMVSPYLRAQQTMKRVLQQVSHQQMIVNDDIIPDGKPQLVADHLVLLAETRRSVLLVSHMPFVSFLSQELLGHGEPPSFATGDILWLSITADKPKLQHMFCPQRSMMAAKEVSKENQEHVGDRAV